MDKPKEKPEPQNPDPKIKHETIIIDNQCKTCLNPNCKRCQFPECRKCLECYENDKCILDSTCSKCVKCNTCNIPFCKECTGNNCDKCKTCELTNP